MLGIIGLAVCGILIVHHSPVSSMEQSNVNYKRLEFEADTYQHRIGSGVLSDEKMVRSSFSFLPDTGSFEGKYSQSGSFFEFYKAVNQEINKDSFLKFSQTCRKIFEESDNDRNKAAAYILLEKVGEKLLKDLKLLKKLEEFKRQHENNLNVPNADEILDYFLNIDRPAEKQR